MADELKPCPFGCDSTPIIWKVKRFREVACQRCKAGGPLCESEEEAIAAWNTRAEPDTRQLIEQRDALAESLEPFSKALGNIADKDRIRWPDNETIEHSGAAEEITWGDLRRACAALASVRERSK